MWTRNFILILLAALGVACGSSTTTSTATGDTVGEVAADASDAVDAGDAATATDGGIASMLSLGANGCPPDFERCGDKCANPEYDPKHCGNCDTVCAKGEACVDGLCEAIMTCGAGEKVCAGACTKVLSDASNCGSCGIVCPGGHSCDNGSCGTQLLGCQGLLKCIEVGCNSSSDPQCHHKCWTSASQDAHNQLTALVCCVYGDPDGVACTGTPACPRFNQGVCDNNFVTPACQDCINNAMNGQCKDLTMACQ